MADALETHNISNLIQGVSQQVEQQRRDTQAEAQFDCINDAVSGCRARPSFELTKFIEGLDASDAYVFDIERSRDEHYLAIVLNGDLKVYDMADGTECSVTFEADKSYLTVSGLPKNRIVSTIIDDHAFIANREIKPAMSETMSPTRPHEALLHFKAGAYSMSFTLTIVYGGTSYKWEYTTPDNSTSGNAAYITTDQLAATFYSALADVDYRTTASGAVSAVDLGFGIWFDNHLIHIWRDDGADFSISTTDGAGNTYFVAVKDTVKAFSYLPDAGVDGFLVKVKGSDGSKDDDYWVSYHADGANGYWEETVAPGIPAGLDAATMPHDLYNTAYRQFTFRRAPWGARVVGDEDSSPNPSFIGKTIWDLYSDHSRLAILHEAGSVWSKSRNPYVFFPDSAQTSLGTDTIDYTIMGGKKISLFRHAIATDEALFLWSRGGQWRVTSGSDPFKSDTIEAKRASSYEFADDCAPIEVGKSLYFASEPGSWAAVRELLVVDGKIRGDTDLSAHVPRYLPSGIRRLAGSDTLRCLVAFSEGEPRRLYLYNFLVSDNQRAQSAWNALRLPEDTSIVWHGIAENSLLVLAQRPTGSAILELDLSSDPADTGETWHQRMDFRFSTAAGLYDVASNTTSVPLAMPLGSDTSEVLVAVKTNVSGGKARGLLLKVVSITDEAVVISGDASSIHLDVGLRITSERTESRFFKRDTNGVVPAESLTVHDVVYSHADTGYYRAEVTLDTGREYSYEFSGRYIGSPNNLIGAVAIDTGQFEIPVKSEAGAYTLRLVNDTHLPSAWQSATVHFKSVYRALPPGK